MKRINVGELPISISINVIDSKKIEVVFNKEVKINTDLIKMDWVDERKVFANQSHGKKFTLSLKNDLSIGTHSLVMLPGSYSIDGEADNEGMIIEPFHI